MNTSMHTFEISYDDLDGYGSIQFCTSKKKAIHLFQQWCIADNALAESVPIIAIQTVYKEADALEYGSLYSIPENITYGQISPIY